MFRCIRSIPDRQLFSRIKNYSKPDVHVQYILMFPLHLKGILNLGIIFTPIDSLLLKVFELVK